MGGRNFFLFEWKDMQRKIEKYQSASILIQETEREREKEKERETHTPKQRFFVKTFPVSLVLVCPLIKIASHNMICIMPFFKVFATRDTNSMNICEKMIDNNFIQLIFERNHLTLNKVGSRWGKHHSWAFQRLSKGLFWTKVYTWYRQIGGWVWCHYPQPP